MKIQDNKVYELAGHYDKELAPNVDAAWSRFQKEMNSEPDGKVVRRNFSRILAIAAGAAVLIAAFFIVNSSNTSSIQTIRTADNETQQIDLPDGSKVWINESSDLSFSDFNEDVRRVTLTGEAFFEVIPNADKPFVVESGDLKVKVLGTSFNVRNYSDEVEEVEVKEGKVRVFKERMKESIVLGKSDRVKFTANKAVRTAGTVENVGGWTSKSLVFNDQPLEEVVDQIEKMYDVKIIIREQELKSCLFKTNFENAPLREIIEVIQIVFNCQIEEKLENAYVLKGGSCQ